MRVGVLFVRAIVKGFSFAMVMMVMVMVVMSFRDGTYHTCRLVGLRLKWKLPFVGKLPLALLYLATLKLHLSQKFNGFIVKFAIKGIPVHTSLPQ